MTLKTIAAALLSVAASAGMGYELASTECVDVLAVVSVDGT